MIPIRFIVTQFADFGNGGPVRLNLPASYDWAPDGKALQQAARDIVDSARDTILNAEKCMYECIACNASVADCENADRARISWGPENLASVPLRDFSEAVQLFAGVAREMSTLASVSISYGLDNRVYDGIAREVATSYEAHMRRTAALLEQFNVGGGCP